jgi:hypothetical protein
VKKTPRTSRDLEDAHELSNFKDDNGKRGMNRRDKYNFHILK